MGVYIKGMEMPKGNDAVTIIIFPNGKVSLAHDRRFAEYAEAVPVPPHGRLKDEDELIAELKNPPLFRSLAGMTIHDVIGIVNDAPTIIEAEGNT